MIFIWRICMNISYDHYKIFYYVVRYGSFTRAANALTSNQPNITRAVSILESQLGCTLFIRTNRGVKLTSEGQKLYEHIKPAVEQINKGEEELALHKTLRSGIISIGASEIALRCFLLPVLADFHKKYSGVKLKISNFSTPQAISALHKGLVDIAFVTTPTSDMKGLKGVNIRKIREIPVCSPELEHLAKKALGYNDIANYPLITLSEGTKSYDMYRDLFVQNGVAFDPDIEVATADMILPMVRSGLGIGFVPEPFLNGVQGVIRLKLKDKLPQRQICCIKAAQHSLSSAASELERMVTVKIKGTTSEQPV